MSLVLNIFKKFQIKTVFYLLYKNCVLVNSMFKTIKGHHVKIHSDKVTIGSRPKLVFIHGLLGNALNWSGIAQTYAADFDVLTYDLRGHGRTGFLTDSYEPEVFAEDLTGLLDELSWERVVAVGHSLGGRILFCAGSRHPERFSKIVIEDIGPNKTTESSMRTADMINYVPAPFESRGEAKHFFEQSFQKKYGKVLSDYMYSNLHKDENSLFDWRFHKSGVLKCLEIGQKRDFWSEYQALTQKHLVLRGEDSGHLSKEVLKKMKDLNPQEQTKEISGAGHWVHFDQRASFVKELNSFIY